MGAFDTVCPLVCRGATAPRLRRLCKPVRECQSIVGSTAATDDGRGCYVPTRTVGHAKFQSDYHHSIPTPSFNHRLDALPVTQPTVSHQAASTLGLRLNIRKQDMKRRLADLVLTNQQSAQLRSISVPYIWAFLEGKQQCWNHVLWVCAAIVQWTASEQSLLSRTNRNRTTNNNII